MGNPKNEVDKKEGLFLSALRAKRAASITDSQPQNFGKRNSQIPGKFSTVWLDLSEGWHMERDPREG